MDNTYYIISKEDLEKYAEWERCRAKTKEIGNDELYQHWIKEIPCPIPKPMVLPTKEEIDKMWPIEDAWDFNTGATWYQLELIRLNNLK